jgi:small-conductance mechanosensitive channel
MKCTPRFQAAGDAHQLLLVDLQVDGHHQLVPQLFIELVKQAINLQINQQQLMSVSSSLKEILTQQIFWVNSNNQKICWVRISFRLLETLISCCWLICRLMAIISWFPSFSG